MLEIKPYEVYISDIQPTAEERTGHTYFCTDYTTGGTIDIYYDGSYQCSLGIGLMVWCSRREDGALGMFWMSDKSWQRTDGFTDKEQRQLSRVLENNEKLIQSIIALNRIKPAVIKEFMGYAFFLWSVEHEREAHIHVAKKGVRGDFDTFYANNRSTGWRLDGSPKAVKSAEVPWIREFLEVNRREILERVFELYPNMK